MHKVSLAICAFGFEHEGHVNGTRCNRAELPVDVFSFTRHRRSSAHPRRRIPAKRQSLRYKDRRSSHSRVGYPAVVRKHLPRFVAKVFRQQQRCGSSAQRNIFGQRSALQAQRCGVPSRVCGRVGNGEGDVSIGGDFDRRSAEKSRSVVCKAHANAVGEEQRGNPDAFGQATVQRQLSESHLCGVCAYRWHAARAGQGDGSIVKVRAGDAQRAAVAVRVHGRKHNGNIFALAAHCLVDGHRVHRNREHPRRIVAHRQGNAVRQVNALDVQLQRIARVGKRRAERQSAGGKG